MTRSRLSRTTSPRAATDRAVVHVVLLDFPLDVHRRAQEHVDGLLREFRLIADAGVGTDHAAVPRRLLSIIDELTDRYGDLNPRTAADRDEAIARGAERVDLHYRVPPEVSEASRHLGEMLDEADRYCAEGRHLLSLVTPDEALRFRRWYLSEFVRQVEGHAPTSWRDAP